MGITLALIFHSRRRLRQRLLKWEFFIAMRFANLRPSKGHGEEHPLKKHSKEKSGEVIGKNKNGRISASLMIFVSRKKEHRIETWLTWLTQGYPRSGPCGVCDVRTDNCPLPIIQAAAHNTTASTASTHTGLAHPYTEKDCQLYNVTVIIKCSINLLLVSI